MTEALPELTDRQRQVYEFIEARIEEWGYPPTIREVGDTSVSSRPTAWPITLKH